MGFFENFKNLVNGSAEDDFSDFETEEEEQGYAAFEEEPQRKPEREIKNFRSEKKVVSYAPSSQMQVVLVRPERFDDVPSIADHLNAKKTVVLNLEAADRDVSRRIIDFLSGVAYANRGSIKKVANSTFIIVPVSVDVSGELMFDDIDSKIYY